jgi:hypothetical protein
MHALPFGDPLSCEVCEGQHTISAVDPAVRNTRVFIDNAVDPPLHARTIQVASHPKYDRPYAQQQRYGCKHVERVPRKSSHGDHPTPRPSLMHRSAASHPSRRLIFRSERLIPLRVRREASRIAALCGPFQDRSPSPTPNRIASIVIMHLPKLLPRSGATLSSRSESAEMLPPGKLLRGNSPVLQRYQNIRMCIIVYHSSPKKKAHGNKLPWALQKLTLQSNPSTAHISPASEPGTSRSHPEPSVVWRQTRSPSA